MKTMLLKMKTMISKVDDLVKDKHEEDEDNDVDDGLIRTTKS